MTRNNPNYDRQKRTKKLSDNVLRETMGKTELSCGHLASGQPIATTFAHRIYVCPQGCGLRKVRR